MTKSSTKVRKDVKVRNYVKKDGTEVSEHKRGADVNGPAKKQRKRKGKGKRRKRARQAARTTARAAARSATPAELVSKDIVPVEVTPAVQPEAPAVQLPTQLIPQTPVHSIQLTTNPVSGLMEVRKDAVAVKEPEKAPELPKPKAEPVSLSKTVVRGILALVLGACAVGAYTILWGILGDIYPGTGGAMRALVPLAVEAAAGYGVHYLISWVGMHWLGRLGLGLAAVAVILACGWSEVEAAREAPAAKVQHNKADILKDALQQLHGEVKLPESTGKEGPKGSKGLHDAQNGMIDLEKGRDVAIKDIVTQSLTNADATPKGQDRLVIMLALLGALGSSCFIPMLELFLLSLESRMAKD